MKIKKITAPSMKEALRLVKMELGEDAIILKSRKVKSGGLFSFLAREQIEVTAAVDHQAPEPIPPPVNNGPRKPAVESRDRSGLRDKYLLYSLRDDVGRIEDALLEIGDRLKYETMNGLPPELNRQFVTLVENEVDKKLAGDLIQEIYLELSKEDCENPLAVSKAVQSRIRGMFSVSGELHLDGSGPKVIALIGPTGVGKTTSIAKISAQYKFFKEKKVALISADTYRMAAIEQLRTFARISSMPLEVVYKPEEVEAALKKHREKDIIIIDTAGRSHRNQEMMTELSEFIEAAEPAQVHLTLSAGYKLKDLLDIVDHFRAVPSHFFLITKLDETTNFGNILNLTHQRPKPISYLTLGQSVPEDIALADRGGLARLVVVKDLADAAIARGIFSAKTASKAASRRDN